MLTLPELSEKLKKVDEISLLEVLEITSEDIVDKFQDVIEEKQEELEEELEEEEEQEED